MYSAETLTALRALQNNSITIEEALHDIVMAVKPQVIHLLEDVEDRKANPSKALRELSMLLCKN